MIKLRVKNKLYFFTEECHDMLIKEYSPSTSRMTLLSHVVVDMDKQELLKCRPPLEEVIELGLKEYLK